MSVTSNLIEQGSFSRRDFLKLALTATGGLLLGEGLRRLSRLSLPSASEVSVSNPEIAMNAIKTDIEEYFRARGIEFTIGKTLTSDKDSLTIYNGSFLRLDINKLGSLYRYFETSITQPFPYRLTLESEEVMVHPSLKEWQTNGTVFIVPKDIGLPKRYSHLQQQRAFTDYREDGNQFITLVRVPSEKEASRSEFTVPQQIHMSMSVEAAQSSVYTTIAGSYGLGLPPLEERFLTQEAFANTFWYVAYNKFHNYPYNPLLFARTEFPSNPASNGRTYSLRSIPVSKDLYNSFPSTPFL